MRAWAVVVIAVLGCKDKPAPKTDPVPLTVADAAAQPPVDAAVAKCIPVRPFGDEARAAGIRIVAHQPRPAGKPDEPPKDMTLLPVGTPTPVSHLKYSDELLPRALSTTISRAWAEMAGGRKVLFTAPGELEGATFGVTLADGNPRVLGIGSSAIGTHVRYSRHVATAMRDREPAMPGGTPWVRQVAVIHDDLDADGTAELIAFVRLGEYSNQTGTIQALVGETTELAVLWADDHLAHVQLGDMMGEVALPLYLVPAALSGGHPLLFADDGTRIAVRDRELVSVSGPDHDDRRDPGADLDAQLDAIRGADAAPTPDAAPAKPTVSSATRVCLQPSTTAAATLVPTE